MAVVGGSEKMPRDVPVIGQEPPLDAYRNFRRGARPFGVGVAHKMDDTMEWIWDSKLTAVNITIARAQHLGPA